MEQSELLKYLDGELNDREAQAVEAWAAAAPENRAELERLYYVTALGNMADVQGRVNTENSWERFRQARDAEKGKHAVIKRIGLHRFAGIAAAFVGGIVVTALVLLGTVANENDVFAVMTPAGQRAQFVLPDGSKVWLNASTRLSYQTSFWSRQREVGLLGEAYFEVTPNKDRPFVVNSKEIKTTVLGTKFNVRARQGEERVVTTLLNGSVRVTLPGKGEDGYVLKPGEVLDVNTETMQAGLNRDETVQDVLLWINGRLTFEQTDFGMITRCLEKHFDVHFVFSDDNLKQECFTCEFKTDDDIFDIVEALSLTNRFGYRVEGKMIYISNH